MARYTGPVCRLCRRERMKLFLKGDRCFKEKCAIEKRGYPPGQHGTAPRPPHARLRPAAPREAEGQAHLRRARAPVPASTSRRPTASKGITGENLLVMLERRLDNVVYSLGFAASRAQARQLVRHGHIAVDGRRSPSPRTRCGPAQTVAVKEASRKNEQIRSSVEIGPRPRRSGLARAATPRTFTGKVLRAADARGHQAADPGAADRRALQPLTRRAIPRRSLQMLWKGFQRPKRVEIEPKR